MALAMDMALVFETWPVAPSNALTATPDIVLGPGFPPAVAARYGRHGFSLPVQHVLAWGVVLDPATAMVFHQGTPLPWSCFFGPHDGRVRPDCAAAAERERSGRTRVSGRRVYCGFNRHWQNYAHWVTQSIPAIAGYAQDPAFRDGILLLPSALPAGYQRALELARIPLPEIMRVDMNTAVAIDELVYSSLLLHHDAPCCLSRAVFARMASEACPEPPPDGWIYVSRADSSARPMRNEPALQDALAAFGIETVLPGALSVEDQIRKFRGARLVIGAHGAGLGNIVFCRPGTVMYELMPAHWVDSFVGPSIGLFAQTAGMHYWVDLHPAQGSWAQYGHKVPWTADMDVTLNRLVQIIDRYPEACPARLRSGGPGVPATDSPRAA